MLKFLAFALGIATVVVLGFLLEAQSQTPTPPPPAPLTTYRIFAPGRVDGRTEEIQLRPQMRGQIVEIPVREGQTVAAGDVLVQLDPQQHLHEVALAQAEVGLALAKRDRLKNGARQHERDEAAALYEAKRAELEQAQLSWARVKRLRLDSAVSQQEADDLQAKVRSLSSQLQAAQARAELLQAPAREDDLQIAEAKIAAARSRLELAKVTLQRTTLKAHSPAQVLRINVEPGELTGPDAAQPTLILSDTSHFRLRAFVEELDAPRVRVGMPATVVADGLPDKTFTGRVTHLSPRMSAKQIWSDAPNERFDTKAREIWIDLDEGEGLVVGLRVDVTIDGQ